LIKNFLSEWRLAEKRNHVLNDAFKKPTRRKVQREAIRVYERVLKGFSSDMQAPLLFFFGVKKKLFNINRKSRFLRKLKVIKSVSLKDKIVYEIRY
jgi:hypothetical protein